MKSNYITAGEYPAKMLRHYMFGETKIEPVHISVNITNRCQLDCKYCASKGRDMSLDMPLAVFDEILDALVVYPLAAVTLTGGGEPLMHPDFEKIARSALARGLKLGLVTNGILVERHATVLKKFSWVRISYDSSRKRFPTIPEGLRCGVSYLYRDGDEVDVTLLSLVAWAKSGRITHLRLGPDINDGFSPPIPWSLRGHKDVIVQDRDNAVDGQRSCWIGLMRPKVDVDGNFYPCCGVQYALKMKQAPYPEILRIGELQDYLELVKNQTPFNGLVCRRCYYAKNNALLDAISQLDNIIHPEFI